MAGRLGVVGLVLVALLVAATGCGSGSGIAETVRTAPTMPHREVVMPDVVGRPVGPAARRLRAIGFALSIIGPDGQLARGTHWVVCRTNPPAGLRLPNITRIELIVARPRGCRP